MQCVCKIYELISLPSLQQYLVVLPSRVDQSDPAQHRDHSFSSEFNASAQIKDNAFILL